MDVQINFHDLQTQYGEYKREIDDAIQNVLNAGLFIMGDEVSNFETLLAQFVGCKHAIACASGTDALTLALIALELKPGEEVITTPFSFISAAEAIALLGATPVFADIDEMTYNIDPKKIAEKISPKTRAIIPVSLYGQPADMDEMNELARSYSRQKKIYIIEDNAQSLGASYRGRKSGNLSDIACTSFFPTKPLGCYGDGGALTLNDDLLAEKIKSLRVHGQSKRYEHKYIGVNARLDSLQAAILTVKLKYFPQEIIQRQKIAANYNHFLANFDLILPHIKEDRSSVYAQYSIRTKLRSKIIDYLKQQNIPTAIHYPKPLHLQDCFKYLHYKLGDFPIAEKVASEVMSLPMSAFVTELQQQYIVNSLAKIVSLEKQQGFAS